MWQLDEVNGDDYDRGLEFMDIFTRSYPYESEGLLYQPSTRPIRQRSIPSWTQGRRIFLQQGWRPSTDDEGDAQETILQSLHYKL